MCKGREERGRKEGGREGRKDDAPFREREVERKGRVSFILMMTAEKKTCVAEKESERGKTRRKRKKRRGIHELRE